MLSRVANSLYWMNRYVERAENYARFISVNFNLVLDMPPSEQAQWEPLLFASGDHPLFRQYFEEAHRDQVLQFMTFDTRNPNSILSCLHRARENARSIREIISKEMWEHLNQFYLAVKKDAANDQRKADDWLDFYNQVKMGSQLFFGIIDSTITRNEGWHFGRLGRFLERADKTSRFIDVKYFILLPRPAAVGSNLDLLQWSALLKSVSAFNMYRQAYRAIEPAKIVEFLILHRTFPRSIYYCLEQAERSLWVIAGGPHRDNRAVKALGKLRSGLEYLEVSDIFKAGLHEYLDDFQRRNNQVDNAIFEEYFALKPAETTDDGASDQ